MTVNWLIRSDQAMIWPLSGRLQSKSLAGAPTMSLTSGRLLLFTIWLALFAVYVVGFLYVGTQPGVNAAQANEAAWTAAYILGPVLAAFATFYLGPNAIANLNADGAKPILLQQLFVLLSLTFVMHGIVLTYFYLNLWMVDWAFPPPGEGFNSRASFGFKLLLFLGTIPIIAVNFVLGTEVKLSSSPPLVPNPTENAPSTEIQ